MKNIFVLLLIYCFRLSASDYSETLIQAIKDENINQINYLILNHGPFDKKTYNDGLELAAIKKNMEMFNILSSYASRTAHKKAYKLYSQAKK